MKKLFLLVAVLLLAACAPAVPPEIEITPMPAPLVGRHAPDFELGSFAGLEAERLSDLRGQTVIIYFWTSWCPYCRLTTPVIEELYQENAGQLVVLGVNWREKEVTVRDYQSEMGITFPIILDPEEKISKAYWVRGVPKILFLDEEGIVGYVHEGQLTKELGEKILKERLGL